MTSLVSRRTIACALALLAAFAGAAAARTPVSAEVIVEPSSGGLGVIKGVVRDQGGSPIAEATVAIFRQGTTKLLKQVTSASDGSFLAKIVPGTYTVLAVAQGFNPVTLFGVEVARSAQLTYGFNLERAGSGNTMPEQRSDRNSSKWRIRAAQSQRSIYQNREGDVDVTADQDAVEEPSSKRKGQAVIETYFADAVRGNYAGVNFATLLPVDDDVEIVFAGQTGKGKGAPQRLETGVKFRANSAHTLRFNSAVGVLTGVDNFDQNRTLGQASFQAMDEWRVRDGVVLVLGLDYSRFFGWGEDSSFSPRFGLQFDIDHKTRVRTAWTSQTEQRSWANAIDLEGEAVSFSEPLVVEDLFIVGNKPRMNKSRRVEVGIERILDDRSSIEANAFVDTTFGNGVGINKFGFDPLTPGGFDDLVADQRGRTEGLRLVYTRRINGMFSTAAGYAFGKGQRLSADALTDPSRTFEDDFFSTFYGQVSADLKTGTSVRTILRLSPQATVFAIDPFKGRLAVYDPGLSVLVSQSLPSLGLPIRAKAIVDARNIFDLQAGISGDEGSLRLNAQRRVFRGGIQVRF